ncbi:MAG: hypothetical protein EP330_18995 [Deltaproteobacteria bacterium]|nr:MAG: hypothetical protein EP330_18995 [Deltaproteobacteria bacterium]
MLQPLGLKNVATKDLEQLLRLVHRGELSCPIDQTGLAVAGMLRLGDDLGHLRGLDEQAVRAVLVAVLAERKRR